VLQSVLRGLNLSFVYEMKTVVDVLYDEYQEIKQFLDDANQPSFRLTIESHFKKNLLLSAASYFEHILTEAILHYCSRVSSPHQLIESFLKNKAISRQYHTYFNWDDKKGANQFFGLFGGDFSKYMKSKMESDELLSNAVSAFLTLGAERNRLVHINFAAYNLEKTMDEIYDLFNKALYFVNSFGGYLAMPESQTQQNSSQSDD